MHSVDHHGIQHGHGHSHGHGQQARPAAPHTKGRLIRWARLYDPTVWIMSMGQTRKLRSMAVDLARLQPGERVLDVGCGTGDLTLVAGRAVGSAGEVWGIDAAPEMIREANRKALSAGPDARVHFEVQAVEKLSFPGGSFDVVLSSLMMHHLPGDLKVRALAEIRRVLRPGGCLHVVDLQPSEASGGAKHTPLPLLWVRKRSRRKPHAGKAKAATGSDSADLAALATNAGFAGVESGPTSQSWIGFLRAVA